MDRFNPYSATPLVAPSSGGLRAVAALVRCALVGADGAAPSSRVPTARTSFTGTRQSVRRRLLAALLGAAPLAAQPVLPGTAPLTGERDLSAAMVDGIHRHLDAVLPRVVAERDRFWRVDFRDRASSEASIAPNRARLAALLGVIDPRVPSPDLEFPATSPGRRSSRKRNS